MNTTLLNQYPTSSTNPGNNNSHPTTSMTSSMGVSMGAPMSNNGHGLMNEVNSGYSLPEGYAQMMAQQQQQKMQFYSIKPKDEEVQSNKRTPDQDEDEDSDTGKEKNTRRKIKIEYIKDKSRRHITFSKRKAGIMKKAYELSTLTGTQVLLLVVSETGLVYTFTTPKLQPLVTKPEGKNLIQSCLNAPDPQLYLDPQRNNPGPYQLYNDLAFDKSLADSSHSGSPHVGSNYNPTAAMAGYGYGAPPHPQFNSNLPTMPGPHPSSSPFMAQYGSYPKPTTTNHPNPSPNPMSDYWAQPNNLEFNSPCLNQPTDLPPPHHHQDHHLTNPTLEN